MLEHQRIGGVPVGTVRLGYDQVDNQDITDHRRYIGGLRDPDHEGFDPSLGLVVDEDGVRGLEAYARIVVHVHGHTRDGQVLLCGKQGVQFHVARLRGVQSIDEQLEVLTFQSVGDDGYLRIHRLPLRHFEVNLVGWDTREHPEIVHQLDRASGQRWKPSTQMPRTGIVQGQALVGEQGEVHTDEFVVVHAAVLECVNELFGCRDVDRFKNGEGLHAFAFIDAPVLKNRRHYVTA